jgi:hypothetical protein
MEHEMLSAQGVQRKYNTATVPTWYKILNQFREDGRFAAQEVEHKRASEDADYLTWFYDEQKIVRLMCGRARQRGCPPVFLRFVQENAKSIKEILTVEEKPIDA